jgi:hypothetical protein
MCELLCVIARLDGVNRVCVKWDGGGDMLISTNDQQFCWRPVHNLMSNQTRPRGRDQLMECKSSLGICLLGKYLHFDLIGFKEEGVQH